MNPRFDVISDFLDGDVFEPRLLGEALADPEGRNMLVDFVLLRHAARTELPSASRRPASRGRVLAAAAAVVVALLGGYQLGHRHADGTPDPPEASRVVQAPGWQTNREGGN